MAEEKESEAKGTGNKEGIAGTDEDLLVPLMDDTYGYLTNAVHTGLSKKTADMMPFIYRVRYDGLCLFDVSKIDARLRVAAKFIARYDPGDVLVVSNRVYGKAPAEKFSEYTECMAVKGRFVSGTLTNPNIKSYCEPKLLIVTDPSADYQVIREAVKAGIPIVAICDSNTRLKNIDLTIPGNAKGKNSLALIYWILTREVLRIKSENGEKFNFDAHLRDFISRAEPKPYIARMHEIQRLTQRNRKR